MDERVKFCLFTNAAQAPSFLFLISHCVSSLPFSHSLKGIISLRTAETITSSEPQLPLVAAWEHSSSSHAVTSTPRALTAGKDSNFFTHNFLQRDPCYSSPKIHIPAPWHWQALHSHKPNKIHLGISSYLLAFPVHSATLIPQWLPGCCISLMHKQPFCCYYKTNYLMPEWP